MTRKKPFSHKQKKQQLLEKRAIKRDDGEVRSEHGVHHASHHHSHHAGHRREHTDSRDSDDEASSQPSEQPTVIISRLNEQPTGKGARHDPNRYRLHFERESRDVVEQRKAISRLPLQALGPESLVVGLPDNPSAEHFIPMPRRPAWSYEMTKEAIERNEERYFRSYIDDIYAQYPKERLSYFELNLETWRQLWRVLEISDVILVIADVRHPVLHFPPSLYEYVTKELKKPLVFVLNKADLVPPDLAEAWRKHFLEKYPELHVAIFTSFPEHRTLDIREVFKRRKPTGKRKRAVQGAEQILAACEHLNIEKNGALVQWRDKLALSDAAKVVDHGEVGDHADDDEGGSESDEEAVDEDAALQTGVIDENERGVHNEFVTIGLVGHPNVGKSSILNGLVGKTVVSCSRTPGHTKHFQTIFLTPRIRLCDSPGLVFPSLVPKQLQILSGMYPIAQVSEPFSVVQYLCERVPVVQILRLELRNLESGDEGPWSAWKVCEAWAVQRGYRTAKAARLDVYRAANSILRLAADGRIIMAFRPPGYVGATTDDTSAVDLRSRFQDTKKEDPDIDVEGLSLRDNEESEEEDVPRKSKAARRGKKARSANANMFALLGDDGAEMDASD